MEAIAWGLPVLLLLLICPLMMVGMGLAAWVGLRFMGRSAQPPGGQAGRNGNGSHAMCGPMMMGHGHGAAHEAAGPPDAGHQHQHSEAPDLVSELKAQRERLDQLIARAEQQAGRKTADAAESRPAGH